MNRLWSMFRSRRLDRELDEEIASHLAMQEEEFRRAGMSESEARNAARREFGGVAQTREIYRDGRGLPWLDAAVRDFRYALRGLAQNKGFAAAAVLSLALGIGANTAIFTIFRALMLRSLPVARPEELVSLYRTGAWGRGYSSYPLYLEVKKRTDLFQDVFARSGVLKVRLDIQSDRLETVNRELVSGNYFAALGIAPAIGRLIGDSDNRTPHAHPVAVLSYDFWQNRFAGDPSVLGRTLVVNAQPLTVIGVAQRAFRGVELDHQPDVWAPAMMAEGDFMAPGSHWAWIMGRRRPGVSRAQVQAAMDVLLQQHLTGVYGNNRSERFRKVAMAQHFEVREGGVGLSRLRDRFGTSLTVLMAAVGLVLLAACANVANLLLARSAARRREIALRVSLGATRWRLIQQGLMESLLLAALGAAAGIAFAWQGTRAILAFLPDPFAAAPDRAVLAYTIAISVAAAILFGLGPALRSARVDPAEGLRMASGAGGRGAIRRVLVTAQVAFSVVLVALAGLFAHSMAQLRAIDLGFANQNAVACAMDPPPSMDAQQRATRRDQLIGRLERLPGVSSVSYAFPGPFLEGSSNANVRIEGASAVKEDSWTSVHTVGPRYFETIGATLVAGRGVERGDSAKSAGVAVVNEAFTRAFLPGERVFDRMVTAGSWGPLRIIGVVRDIAHDGLRSKPAATVYIPAQQHHSDWEPTIVVRAAIATEPLIAAIRREFAAERMLLDGSPKPLRQRIDESVFEDRLLATIGGFFGLIALALAAVGLYGVVAYGTARRAREIGVRIALGARRGEVLGMILADAMQLVTAGLVLGLPAAYAAAVAVKALLFDVKPLDVASLVATTAVLGVVGLGAAFVPARRAASLEPLSVLRQD